MAKLASKLQRGQRMKLLTGFFTLGILAGSAFAQTAQDSGTPAAASSSTTVPQQSSGNGNAVPQKKIPKHILWVIPNFRTSETLHPYTPISVREKYRIAAQDTFDRGTVALAAAFAGEAMISRDERAYGEGVEGYAAYFAASYADFAIENYLTEAVLPSLLHDDPRYFRRGEGSALSRLGYAMGQIFVTHNDSGHTVVNVPELAGSAGAVAISMAYYPDSRDTHDALVSWASQVGVDMLSNIVKEFWHSKTSQ
jgi:hypothetical protein